jgi:cytochrome c551/c552
MTAAAFVVALLGGVAIEEHLTALPLPPAQTAVSAGRQAPDDRAAVGALLSRYCITCHNERLKTAGLMLDKVAADVAGDPATWEKVVRKLRSGAMPPSGMPRPDPQTYHDVVSLLEAELDRAAAADPNPGRSPAHRLNRAEYANAIRDVLALDVDVRSLLPADDAGYGFDNNADVLTLSPTLLERYLSAARFVSRRAVGHPAVRPTKDTYKLPEAPVLMQNERMSEDLPFGSRGGLAIRHHFPVDGEYELKIRLQRVRDGQGEIRGLYEPTQLDVRLDGERLRQFSLGRVVTDSDGRPMDPELVGVSLDSTDRQLLEYEISADSALQLRFSANAGTRTVSVAFVHKGYEPEWTTRPRMTDFGFLRNKGGDPDIDTVEIGGPYTVNGVGDTPSRRAIFVCDPGSSRGERVCAQTILSGLARTAYRRAPTREDVTTLLSFFDEGRRKGGFEAGIEAALVRTLVDPDFLFRIGRDPAGAKAGTLYRISDVELASRLSFFLWSSIPDPELLELAVRNKLIDPRVLERQVRRMLADDRAQALVSNFAGQWLHLRNLRTHAPDREIFPEFDDNLRTAFQRETELFFASIIREDRSVLDLLTGDYTFVNERLARYYGIPGVYGSHFRRVTLPSDQPRAGVLGHGSVLTVTSYATRTSPVLRGKWVLENILGAPPPPPPPDVPALKDEGGGKRLSMRAAMELHRRNPVCASCHARMDPLGFALENFNAVGGWRTVDSGAAIDASGVLPDGTRFAGPAELRRALGRHADEFVATTAEKLLTYALGRGIEYYDAPAIRRITREAAAAKYSFSSMVLGVVRSLPFQMRRAGS